MTRLRAVRRWLLGWWPLAWRSTARQGDAAAMSLVGELERMGAHLDQALRDQDVIERARQNAVARADRAEQERDNLAGRLAGAERELARLRFALAALPTDVVRLRHMVLRDRRTALVREDQLAAAEGRPVHGVTR